MNTSINCKISLSKKLRNILGKEGTVTLTTSNLIDGKGFGRLSLMSDSNVKFEADNNETAIMITPVEITDEIPLASDAQASIFSTIAPKGQEDKITRKIAVVNAPEKGEESKAVSEVKTPQEFKNVDRKECKSWIDDMTGLINAVNAARSKISSIDPSKGKNDREKAVLMGARDREEAIGIPTWIVTDNAGSLSLNDLNVSLKMGIPFDLGNISARKIAASADLKSLLSQGYIKFISPEEKDRYLLKAVDEIDPVGGLDVFDSPDEAEANMTKNEDEEPSRKATRMEFTEEELSKPTEEETMLINLTQNLPTQKAPRILPSTDSQPPRHTVHGSSDTERPKPSVKPIRKLD